MSRGRPIILKVGEVLGAVGASLATRRTESHWLLYPAEVKKLYMDERGIKHMTLGPITIPLFKRISLTPLDIRRLWSSAYAGC